MVKNKYLHICSIITHLSSTNKQEIFDRFFSKCDILFRDSDIVAAITYLNKHFCLIIGNDFFKYSTEHQVYVLAHELVHMMYKHPLTFSKFAHDEIFQISADLFVNQILNKILPSNYIPPDSVQISWFIDNKILTKHDVDKDTMYYYQKLSKYSQKIKVNQSGSHEEWSKFEHVTELEKISLVSAIDSAYKNAGNIHGAFRDLPTTKFKSTLNWKQLVSRFISNSFFTEEDRDLFHINKRFIGFPGKYEKEIPYLLFSIDTSGSIDNDDISEMFAQINKAFKAGCKIDILEVDQSIRKPVYLYDGNPPEKLSGGGGTDFNPAIDFFNKNNKKYGAMIYLTDGHASTPRIKSLKPLLWVLTSSTSNTPESLKENNFKGLVLKINHE